MTRNFLILSLLVFLALGTSSFAQCPQDENDRGVCDTIYYQAYDNDTLPTTGAPYFVRVPIFVTNDVVTPATDSISGFVIPLCFHATDLGAATYCSLSTWWNGISTISVTPEVTANRSIFRHLPSMQDPQIHNRMMDMNADFVSGWDFIFLNLGDQEAHADSAHFWLSMVPTGSADQGWWEGSHVLLATMTFKLGGDVRLCMDTCVYLPSNRLAFGTTTDDFHGVSKVPRSGTGSESYEYCFDVRFSDVRELGTSDESRPSSFSLAQNYPNPFNPVTNIEFTVVRSAHVKIDVFNIVGQKVATLVDQEMKPGVYSADWNGTDQNGNAVSSGIYFYRMEAGEFAAMKKMLLLK